MWKIGLYLKRLDNVFLTTSFTKHKNFLNCDERTILYGRQIIMKPFITNLFVLSMDFDTYVWKEIKLTP